MPPKHRSLGLKFSLSVGLILLSSCALFSLVLYQYLRYQALNEAQERTHLIMTQVGSIGGYVRETLRPTIFRELERLNARDAFIIEAMSTTHVSLEVMRRFNREFKEFNYHRAAESPKNPANSADVFHRGLITYFRANPEQANWSGIVDLQGGKYLVEARPVRMETGCLLCHGEPADAPRELVRLYGNSGFHWEVGSVIGVDSVAIPLDVALGQVRKIALDTFLFGAASLFALFFALYGTFRQLVTRPLNDLSGFFRRIARGTQPLGRMAAETRNDEIGVLTDSFNTMAGHLLEAEEKLKKTAELERQLMETEKLASLGQLSAGVAHEINNPLGGIKLCLNNLLNTPMDDKTRLDHVSVINSGLDRIQNIVRQLLDFSKNSPLSLAPAGVNRIIENVLTLAEYTLAKQGVTIVKKLGKDIPDLMVDANKLEQVFLNLFINAAQAMHEGGVLTIRTRHEGAFCHIEIMDTGPGIAEEIQAKVFDPFFTTKGVGEGTGLGLTVTKAIVEQHRGELSLQSSSAGTTFTIRLPLS